MRYWGILLAKVVVAGVLLFGIWLGLNSGYKPPAHVVRYGFSPFGTDLHWTTTMFVYFLLCSGVLALIVLDQRYRCRTCGRRLRMPVSRGRYAQQLLFGRPQTEYICAYGHGKYTVSELHVGSQEPPAWESHADFWKELYAIHDAEAEKKK